MPVTAGVRERSGDGDGGDDAKTRVKALVESEVTWFLSRYCEIF